MASIIPNQYPRIVDQLEADMNKALAEQRNAQIGGGPVTAEMAMQQYEATAGAIGMLREVIKDQVERQSATLADLHNTMKIVEDAAVSIRDRGVVVYEDLERARAVSEEIRQLVAECLKKVGA